MSTTSLKLPDDLKAKATTLAMARHQSTHAYLVEAIRRATDQDERRQQFIEDSILARQQAMVSGEGYSANQVHEYIRKKAGGANASRPKPQPWRK
jgi:predicted transcriptional regulator